MIYSRNGQLRTCEWNFLFHKCGESGMWLFAQLVGFQWPFHFVTLSTQCHSTPQLSLSNHRDFWRYLIFQFFSETSPRCGMSNSKYVTEGVAVCIKVVSQHLPVGTEKNHEDFFAIAFFQGEIRGRGPPEYEEAVLSTRLLPLVPLTSQTYYIKLCNLWTLVSSPYHVSFVLNMLLKSLITCMCCIPILQLYLYFHIAVTHLQITLFIFCFLSPIYML